MVSFECHYNPHSQTFNFKHVLWLVSLCHTLSHFNVCTMCQQLYMFSQAAALFTPAAITAKKTLGKKDRA